MWYKLTLAVFLIIALITISQEKEQEALPGKDRTITRHATNIVMYERKRDTGKSMVVSAKELIETGDRISQLKDFRMAQQKGVTLSGRDATYDREDSILEVKGPLDIETADGTKAKLDGLIWNRESRKAFTPNPVNLVNKDGIIKADRAEFSEEFSEISLIGNVHAQIAQNFLDH
jgi:hypothetical protein